ncbi:MAG: hypothetical protein HN576_12145 [Bacteriovoracaceae bacterium]|jgi:hypothetical protein|nr:hypothetical protein [Bacteriovoracaceae bacterium]
MKKGFFSFNKKKKQPASLAGLMLLTLLLPLLESCLTNTAEKSTRRSQQGVINNSNTVATGFGRILQDNPIILTGNPNLNPGFNIDMLLQLDQDFIVNDQFLSKTCINNIASCMSVTADQNTPQFNSSDAKWAYPGNSLEFLQVNTFGHLSKTIDRFHEDLQDLHTLTWGNIPFGPTYNTAIPEFIFPNNGHWMGTSNLKTFANCDVINDARFDPAAFTICLGRDLEFDDVKFAQDNTVIYHEFGHALNMIAMNMRNNTLGLIEKSDLGYLFYDEAGSIGEGLADYASYMMTYPQRPHIGEWALGRFNLQSRPLREDDPLHVAGLDTEDDSRLSYPQYLLYDPNQPEKPIEDVHYAGQIISHFLVALTEDFMSSSYCGMTQKLATSYVMYMVVESLAELGDISALGSDNNTVGYVNLNQVHALEWIKNNKPINFRSFSQAIAKNVNRIMNDFGNPRCAGGVYNKDRLERLLDSYGLLLFKNYNEDGNQEFLGHVGGNNLVNDTNRLKTVLIPKDLLMYDPNSGASKAFIIDGRSNVKSAYDNLSASGQVGSLSSQIEADLPFNNGNARVSPGELVGISLNLYNDSNSEMAGIQILANDWDHVKWDDTALPKPYKKGKLCNTFGDNFPLSSEGAADTSAEANPSLNAGDCNYITRDNGDQLNEQLAPVCFVEISEASATKWGLQEEFRESIALEPSNCLSGSSDTRDCFIRMLKGADQAIYSKINPKANYGQSIALPGQTINFSFSNIIFMEISPWIPPGTTFNCRFRTRFSNCEDCYNNDNFSKDDHLDYEFSGGEAFKLINFQFTVID